MLYWSRSGSFSDLTLALVLCAGWAVGGWLLARSLFPLRRRERLTAGAALGLLAFITTSNLLVPWLGTPIAFWAASAVVLAVGLGFAARTRASRLPARDDLAGWPALLGAAAVAVVFSLALRGLGLFDDYLHLPLVATMARGNIPPRFYLDPDLRFAYHYGLQVFSAALVSVGGLFPWSAWDLGRGLAFGLTAAIAWLWMRRVTGSRLGAWLGSLLACLGGGTRWLLVAIPAAWLDRMTSGLDLQPTALMAGSRLSEALRGLLHFQGGGPMPFPFAATNTNYPPLNIHLGSTGALPNVTLLLLLLLAGSGRLTTGRAVALGIVLSGLGLSAENAYAGLFFGLLVILAAGLVAARSHPDRRAWIGRAAALLAVSAVLVLIQGGFITETIRSIALRMTGPSLETAANLRGFAVRWPPAIFSGHLGSLSVFNPGSLVVLLAELGPVLWVAPPVTLYFLCRRQRLQWMSRAAAAGALVSFIFPLLFSYGLDRSITRLPETAMWIWSTLGFALVFRVMRRASVVQRALAGLAYAAVVCGGVVLLVVELAAIQTYQFSYFIQYGDAKISRDYWDRIGPQDRVFDVLPERSVTLFGRPVFARTDVYADAQTVLPEWANLRIDPQALLQAGYTYAYVDETWWGELPAEARAALAEPCVDEVGLIEFGDEGGVRRLLDLRACR